MQPNPMYVDSLMSALSGAKPSAVEQLAALTPAAYEDEDTGPVWPPLNRAERRRLARGKTVTRRGLPVIMAGGKPSKGTPPDKRLKENKGTPKKAPFPGAAPPFKAPKKGK